MKLKQTSLGLIFVSLSAITQPTFAQATAAAETTVVQTNAKTWVYVTAVCKMGLQFLVATQDKHDSGGASGGLVMIQVMAPAAAGSAAAPQPLTCKVEPNTVTGKSPAR
jgi:hypothetical protein